jgi:hypothetical protein
MERISKLLLEDSVIHYIDGQEIKGSKEIACAILGYCKAYNSGYMKAMKLTVVKGLVLGVVLFGTGVVISKVIKSKKKKIEV